MPRASQSRESGIVNYFKTAELPIAKIVLGLAKDAVAERTAKSSEARERALKAHAPKPKAKDPVSALSTPVAAPKAKKRRKKRAKKAQPAAEIEGAGSVYDEADLNG